MDYQAMRNLADSLITEFSNGEPATLLKGEKVKDQQTGAIKKTFREVPNGLAVMTSYSEKEIAESKGVIEAGDVKFICRFSEKPMELQDRIRYASVEYNVLKCRPIDPTGGFVVTYVIQGRRA